MTAFGRRAGDMKKSVYDSDNDSVVDLAAALEPGAVVDATKLLGVDLNDADIGDTKILSYDLASGKLVYVDKPSG